MVSSTLVRGILALVLASPFAAAQSACTKTVTAKQGDTCATLSSSAGITVTQFLRSNPYVTSCSNLVAGAGYCVEGTATTLSAAPPSRTSSAPPPAASTSGPLKVSTDGTCGDGVTCAGSRFGSCCSAHGYCGSTADYCGDGCQAGLGQCDGGSTPPSSQQPPSSGPTTPPPAVVTSTAIVTRTTVVIVTSTNQASATRTVIVTSTAITTSTVVQTNTAIASATQTATTRVTSVVTLTSIVTSVSVRTSTSIQTSVNTLTTVLTSISTRVVTNTVGCSPTFIIGTTPTFVIGGPTTTRGQAPARPSPTLPGSAGNCKSYDKIQAGDTCRTIATRNNISLRDFYDLNPKIDCDNLWEGYYVCTST